MNIIYTVIFNLGLFFFFIFLFRKELINDLKNFNFEENIWNIVIYWAIISMFNFIFMFIVKEISPNQTAINEVKSSYLIIVILLSSFTAPVIEELVFRFSLRVFIKKDIIFIIVSSLLFGLMHIIPIDNVSDIVYILIYALMGAVFSYSYVKHKNVIMPISVHILNNVMSNLMPMLF